jgi:hypothetical protein
VSFEDRRDLLGHKSARTTTHYSAAELANLIAAAEKVCEEQSHNSPQPSFFVGVRVEWMSAKCCLILRSLVPAAGIEPATPAPMKSGHERTNADFSILNNELHQQIFGYIVLAQRVEMRQKRA